MIEVITEISLFLIVAILLGFIFGWFISKSSWKERYEKELERCKALQEKEYVGSDEEFIKRKDEIIENLTVKLSQEEEKVMALKQEHEKEMSAFLFERTDITQKYKELLAKIEEIKKSQSL